MKRILVTGANSYIGTSFERWISTYPEDYSVDTIDMIDGSWRKRDFSGHDVVFHVAGIAHVSTDPKKRYLYYKINRDLAIETAQKAKNEGIKQFIFMSSIIVYGDSSDINKEKVIRKSTLPQPSNFYGDSKLQAEKGIQKLQDDNFKVVILRPPMIYGKGSRGNYQRLAKLAKILPLFPEIDNQRSVLYIDNLCELIRLIIDDEDDGIFYPQNAEYVSTSKMVKLIVEAHHKKLRLTRFFNTLIIFLGKRLNIVNKVFGNLAYDKSLSSYKNDYCIVNFEESIKSTEM